MKRLYSNSRTFSMVLAIVLAMLMFCVPVFAGIDTLYQVYASDVEDTIGDTMEDLGESLAGQPISEDDQNVADWLTGQRGVTSDQLQTASKTLSPITNAFGYIAGGIIILTIAGVTVITALDLLYIAVPPVRNLLYKAGTDGTGAFTGGMPAGGYRGGMGGMYAGGIGGAAGGTAKPTQWVSDEAIACAALTGGSASTQPAMGIGGMGMYGGGIGMAGMNPAMNGAANQDKTYPLRTVIGMYFKKRVVFMVLLGLCVIVLTSSVLMDTGINLAKWFIKLMNALNGHIPG